MAKIETDGYKKYAANFFQKIIKFNLLFFNVLLNYLGY
jgi:hypothetical protein